MGSGTLFLGRVECAKCDAVLEGAQGRFRLFAQSKGWVGKWVAKQEVWCCPRHATPPLPMRPACRTCGGSGWIAQKRCIDDGMGEVDTCPDCGDLPATRTRKVQPWKEKA